MVHIHHVQISVQNGTKYLRKFTRNANFQLFATRKSGSLRQWAVRSGSVIFLISERGRSQGASEHATGVNNHDNIENGLPADTTKSEVEPILSPALPDQCFWEPSRCSVTSDATHSSQPVTQQRDTVFNVAFEVSDVTKVFTRAVKSGAEALCSPTVVYDSADGGHVTIAAVKSCVGNIVHTLIDCSNYNGVFLPGFVAADNVDVSSGEPVVDCKSPKTKGELQACLLNYIDHVTYVCPMGSSSEILEWYERCFGMKRFLLARGESEAEGFLVQGKDVGICMKAMEYWRCAETGLTLPSDGQDEGRMEKGRRPRPPKARFVIAEPLPGQGLNHVETFLEQHCGAGIQHIGLHTHNIIQAVSCLRQSGLSFMEPPTAYYTEVGKRTDISRIIGNVEILQRLGILLDEETSLDENEAGKFMENRDKMVPGSDEKMPFKYLMQVFTKPIFERDTFFLEVIQRQGATGFGEGNIKALWRAVQSYMGSKDH